MAKQKMANFLFINERLNYYSKNKNTNFGNES